MVAWDNKEVRTETNNSQIKWFLMAGGGSSDDNVLELEMVPTPVLSPGKSQGRGSLVGCHLWVRTESDTNEAT